MSDDHARRSPTGLEDDGVARTSRRPMGTVALVLWALIAALAVSGFVALGQWQVQRRAWKLDLIEQVQTRIHIAAVAAPARAHWPDVAAAGQDYAYRHVTLEGAFLHAHTTLVQASTVLGAGWWVMTPLAAGEGTVLVNRGFVPQAQTDGAWRTRPQGRVTVTGLLRLSEPGGAWLRGNDPATGRWTSRDVGDIAASQGLQNVAPYFVDAEAGTPLPPALRLSAPKQLPEALLPVAGLTVVSFPNNHLVYALTWFGLALMVAGAAAYVGREEIRLRRDIRAFTIHLKSI